MASFLFSQHAQGWQQMFRRSQSGGFFSRLFAWLMLGVVLMVGLLLIVTVLLLSWLLIPVLLYKRRRALKARVDAERAYHQSSHGDIIDGIITEIKEDKI